MIKKPEIPLKTEFLMYITEDGKIKIDTLMQNETVWLTQEQMAELFDKAKSTVNEHIKNVFLESELKADEVMKKFGNSEFTKKPTNYYNLDVVISVGYRVKSLRGTQFRIWATQRLKEYIVKGFTMDDDRLKQPGGGGYFDELLARIRDIRSSDMPPVWTMNPKMICRVIFLLQYKIRCTGRPTGRPLLRLYMAGQMRQSVIWD